MKITFLGTGTSQGVPVIACDCETCTSNDTKDNRLRSSVLIEDNGHFFVIDSGPDFRQQLLREKIKKLHAVVFTHEHKDHIAGLDDVRSFNWITKKPMEIYCSANVKMAIEREFFYVFTEDKYPGVPELSINIITEAPFNIFETKFIPIRGLHCKLPVFGYRIGDFAYITDMNFIEDSEKNKLKGLKILVVGAVRKKKHISHFNLEEAVSLINELKPEMAYITHISHYMGLHSVVNNELPPYMKLAHDGLSLTI